MIVPRYWAEGKVRHREVGKQVTMRRFGWSDDSQKDAQDIADARAKDALGRFLSGEKLMRYEPKTPYNGADGVPIREEIVDRRGETVLTRNSYGALCLNTPDVFFIDVDFEALKTLRCLTRVIFVILVIIASAALWNGADVRTHVLIALGSAICAPLLASLVRTADMKARGGRVRFAMRKVDRFIEGNPLWNLRVYRTPAGLRLLAAHRTFDPADPEVVGCFEALGSDPVYRLMCLKQRCFRARVSPKPWRIGMESRLRPRPGVWPVKAEHLPGRRKWIARYESASEGFSSCSYVETKGNGSVDPAVVPVMEWHDELSRAETGLPSA